MNKIFRAESKVACLDVHSPLYIKTRDNFVGGDIGDLYKVIDKASEVGFHLVQFTPVQDTGFDPCPYMGISIFSFNPIFLSIDKLTWLPSFFNLKKDFIRDNFRKKTELVDYKKLYNFKLNILRESFENSNFTINPKDYHDQILAYAVFTVLKNKFKTPWSQWPNEFKYGRPEEIIKNHTELLSELQFVLYCQSLLKEQWQDLENYAKGKGVELVFDKPIYPIYESSDVWANQDLFYLNSDGSLKYVSGANIPGDPFGPQKWGHAVYKFKESPDKVVKFFLESIRHLAGITKVIRLDHTLALIWKYYIVKPSAENGTYLPGLRDKLFSKLKKEFPNIFFIAEDLGFVNEKLIDKPLQKYGIPGMRCLQWFGDKRYFETKKYPKICVAITSNHDMLSLPAWWHQLSDKEKELFYQKITRSKDSSEEILQITKLVFESPAKIASITLRDIIGDLRRYNLPGTQNKTNWVLHSPCNLEDIDFSPIIEIIKETGR